MKRFRLALNITETILVCLIILGFMLSGSDEPTFHVPYVAAVTDNDIYWAKFGVWMMIICAILLMIVFMIHFLRYPDSFNRKTDKS